MRNVTVIISARDSTAWLEQCIASVCRQRLPRGWSAEVALGIDACGSTLRAAEFLQDYGFVGAYFPRHVGPYVIFNSLACSFPGDVFVRFDADDVMQDGYLESQIAMLGPALSPVIIQTGSTFVDEHLHPIRARSPSRIPIDSDNRQSGATGGQFLFTSAVWERLGGFQPWLCAADTEFVRRAYWAGVPNKVVQKHLYLRRVHSHSLSRSALTGRDSPIRRNYHRHIEDARQRYIHGTAPERIFPVTAGYYLFRVPASARRVPRLIQHNPG